jgi:hypothetical protein
LSKLKHVKRIDVETIENLAIDIAERMEPSDDDIENAFGESEVDLKPSDIAVIQERLHSAMTEELYKICKETRIYNGWER